MSTTYDISALVSGFVGGAEVFGKEVLNWDLRNLGYQIRTNVKTPQALTKFTADGEPRPYRQDDDFNGGTFSGRELKVLQSKYDQLLDSEELRNTYLAELPEAQNGELLSFEQYAVMQAVKQYLSSLMTSTIYSGVRDANGDAAADICDGFGTIIAAEIIATNLDEIGTGAITSSNAVTKVEQVADGVTTQMKRNGFIVKCSYDVLQKYRIHYRTLNGYGFNKNEVGQYKLDGMNATLVPDPCMGASQRLIATYPGNLIVGTDTDNVRMFPTPYLNLLKNRIMFPIGCQIRDLDVLFVNDQA